MLHSSPGGICYPRGYSSIDLFYGTQTEANWYTYIDARAHIFNDGKPAINLGIGSRYLCECSDMIYGINLYWDYRDAKHTTFHALGAGVEFFWPCWEIHLNGYVPVNRHKKSYRTGFQEFSGNSAIFYKKYELAMSGGDITLGYKFLDCDCFDIKALITGYYFQGDYGEHAGGGMLRLRSNITDWITVEGSVSYDNEFKWLGQGELALNFPFGGPVKRCQRAVACCEDLIAIEEQLVSKPERFEIIVTTSHKKKSRARNPFTGDVMNFIFVNNLVIAGAGTIESPYPTVTEARDRMDIGDVIYVFPGDRTTNGYNEGVVLREDAGIFGAGRQIDTPTRFGDVVIPRQTSDLPILENPIGPVITIEGRGFVCGMRVEADGDDGILAPAGTKDLIVRDNEVLVVNGRGIFGPGAEGKWIIERNMIAVIGTEDAINILWTGKGEMVLTANRVSSENGTGVLSTTQANEWRGCFEFNNIVGDLGALFIDSNGVATKRLIYEKNDITGNFRGITVRDYQSTLLRGNVSLAEIDVAYSAIASNLSVRTIALNNEGIAPLGARYSGGNPLFPMVARVYKESAVVPPGIKGVTVAADGGLNSLFVISPNGALSGVEAINFTPVGENGPVIFIPN